MKIIYMHYRRVCGFAALFILINALVINAEDTDNHQTQDAESHFDLALEDTQRLEREIKPPLLYSESESDHFDQNAILPKNGILSAYQPDGSKTPSPVVDPLVGPLSPNDSRASVNAEQETTASPGSTGLQSPLQLPNRNDALLPPSPFQPGLIPPSTATPTAPGLVPGSQTPIPNINVPPRPISIPPTPIVIPPSALTPPTPAPITSLPGDVQELPEESLIEPDPLVDRRAIVNSPAQQEKNNLARKILINFNNVNIVEFIRFISKVSNKNFVFDEGDLQFNVTIISEEATSIENVMTALLQELRIHGLTMFEQGNNVIIHKNPAVNAISRVVSNEAPQEETDRSKTEIVTQLFRLNTTDPDKVAPILKPLVSDKALIEVFRDTNQIIVTDLVANVKQIGELLKNIDSPINGLVIGQYVVRRGVIDSLVQLAQQIMRPISQDQTLFFVPHRSANSIFVVTTPFLMERTMAILQYLDQHQGLTRIFNLQDLKFSPEALLQGQEGGGKVVTPTAKQGEWQLDSNGDWVFRPFQQAGLPSGAGPPQGYWDLDENGNWRFRVGETPTTPRGLAGITGPEGQWKLDSQGFWVFQLAPERSISPERLVRAQRGTADLPAGNLERTQFYIHKLHYRSGNQVESALGRIGVSLRQTGDNNSDLIQTIESVQWIEASNSLIFTGTTESLDKVRELVLEIDSPLRQVFIEMLIIQTTLEEALTYGVNWGSRFGGGNTAGAEAFLSNNSPLPQSLATTAIGLTPDATALSLTQGFSLGIVGRTITRNGKEFASIGALIKAVHNRLDTKVVICPKLLTEDNYAAEVFAGLNVPFPAQSIANDRGQIITQNFDYRDVGTRFKVTPQIGDNGVVTLTIIEEVSSIVAATANRPISQGGPTTRKSYTTTKVHMPNEFFLVISGIMEDDVSKERNQVPCLGGVPFLGAGFSEKNNVNTRNNLMIFIRPRIIDTQEEMDNVTFHEQDIFTFGRRYKASWRYETDEAMDFFNLPGCDGCCDPDCECGPGCD